jgi:hypothetical protein
MGDYVLESNPALERLMARLRAQGEPPPAEESSSSNGYAQRSRRGRRSKVCAADHPEDFRGDPTTAGANDRSPGRRKRSLRKAEHDARKAEKSSKKAAAADHLDLSFLDHMSFLGPNTKQWRLMATPDLRRVSSAERRFAISVSHSKAAMLAAADELDAATRDATTWLTTHPCPDSNLGDQVARFVNTCAEVAVTSRWSVANPLADTHSVMSRLGALLSVIDRQVQTLDAW